MCILDIFRLHVSHNYNKKKCLNKYTRSDYTDMSMVNWSKKKTSSSQIRSKKVLLQLPELDDENLPSISESICCSDYIINGGFCNKDHLCGEEDK